MSPARPLQAASPSRGTSADPLSTMGAGYLEVTPGFGTSQTSPKQP